MDMNEHKIFWGDIHCHTNISYGKGTPQRAFLAAAQHLDFCSVTGHSSWPDMPDDLETYDRIIGMHLGGFAKLRKYWPDFVKHCSEANRDEEFVTFLSCEWHSQEFGDYNIYWPSDKGSPVDAETLEDLIELADSSGAILLPHHIGYGKGERGINWDAFNDRISPLAEIYSSHGSSERDCDSDAYYHSMGPRLAKGTAVYGLDLGHKFGFIGSTDDHVGFPGNYGDGRCGVFAGKLSRESIWDSLLKRKTIAVTGDRIDARMWVSDAFIGEESICSDNRDIRVEVEGEEELTVVEIVKNGKVLARRFGGQVPNQKAGRYKLRIEWGWGEPGVGVKWNGHLNMVGGVIDNVNPYFSLPSGLDPSLNKHELSAEVPSRIMGWDETSCIWESQTWGHPGPKIGSVNCLVLDIKGEIDTALDIKVNDISHRYLLRDMITSGSEGFHLSGHGSAAVKIHQPVTAEQFGMCFEIEDKTADREIDYYYLRVYQKNGQIAWTSPIWVKRG